MDERRLFLDTQAIQSLYEQSGFKRQAVQNIPQINEDNGSATVTFRIDENQQAAQN